MDSLTLQIPTDISVGRGEALRKSLMDAHAKWVTSKEERFIIVEIGTLRDDNPQAQFGDGWSSILWAWYAKQNPKAQVHLIDIDENAIRICERLIRKHIGEIPPNVVTYVADADDWLRTHELETGINLLYLDGSDCPVEMVTQFSIVENRNTMSHRGYLVLDDIPANWQTHGKGTMIIPRLMRSEQWSLVLDDRAANQQLYRRV